MWKMVAVCFAVSTLCLTLVVTAPAVETVTNADGTVTITLTPDEVAECKAGGGCAFASYAGLRALIESAAKNICSERRI